MKLLEKNLILFFDVCGFVCLAMAGNHRFCVQTCIADWEEMQSSNFGAGS
jgi:hypothetical protein